MLEELLNFPRQPIGFIDDYEVRFIRIEKYKENHNQYILTIKSNIDTRKQIAMLIGSTATSLKVTIKDKVFSYNIKIIRLGFGSNLDLKNDIETNELIIEEL